MSGSEAPGLWHCVSSGFVIFAILQSMEWPASDYHNSIVFMNKNGKINALVPLIMKKML